MSHASTPLKMLQQLYNSANHSRGLQLLQQQQQQQLTSERIDELIDIELQRLRPQFVREELIYAEQMVEKFRAELDGRKQHNKNDHNKANSADDDDSLLQDDMSDERLVRLQRAESCRKSRRNNKIKKAKMQYRHQFMTERLQQSRRTLDCVHAVLAQAEQQLLCQGYSATALQQLRHTFGLDRAAAATQEKDI